MSDDYLRDVYPSVGLETCKCCLQTITKYDRIVNLMLVTGIGPNPKGVGKCSYVSDFEEYAHFDCKDRKIEASNIVLPRPKAMSEKPAHLFARTQSYECVSCKKYLEREDRIIRLMLAEGIAIDPDTKGPAIQCSSEYEVIHFDCKNPKLKNAVLVVNNNNEETSASEIKLPVDDPKSN